MVGRLLSLPFGFRPIFTGELLVSGRVVSQNFPGPQPLAVGNLSADFAKIRSAGPWDKTPGGISCSKKRRQNKGCRRKGSLQEPGNPDDLEND